MIQFKEKVPAFDYWRLFSSNDGGFSKEECEKIKSLFKNEQIAQVGEGEVNDSLRKTKIHWENYSHDSHWIFERLGQAIAGANFHYWSLAITGMDEALQIGKYNEGSFYNWHTDNGGKQFAYRKLSAVCLLTDPAEFEGGDLEIKLGGKVQKEQGAIVVFPSHFAHRVTPIFKGERMSLVSWISGPPLR
jgi:PKHD-type hydroxylase